jgi:hypothetical protein
VIGGSRASFVVVVKRFMFKARHVFFQHWQRDNRWLRLRRERFESGREEEEIERKREGTGDRLMGRWMGES